MQSDREYILRTHGFEIHLKPCTEEFDEKLPVIPEFIRVEVPDGKLNETLKMFSSGRNLRISAGREHLGYVSENFLFKVSFDEKECSSGIMKRSMLGVPFETDQCIFIREDVNRKDDVNNFWIEEITDTDNNVTGILFMVEEDNSTINCVWGELWDPTGSFILSSFAVWGAGYGHRVIMTVNPFGDEMLYLTDKMPEDEWQYRFWETDPEKRQTPPFIAAVNNRDFTERALGFRTYIRAWRINIGIKHKVKGAAEAHRRYDIRDIFYDSLR